MNTVKFVSANENETNFAKTVRQNVLSYFTENNLSTKGNKVLYLQTFVMLSLYIVPFILILALKLKIGLVIFFLLLIGIGMAGTGMCVMHDALHGSYSEKKWINTLMGNSMYILGANVFNWKVQHNLFHHTYTNIDGLDEDIAARGPIRLSESAPLKKIHKYQYIHAFFFYGLLTISKLIKDFTQLAKYNKEGVSKKQHIHPKAEYFKMILFKCIYLFVIIGLPIIYTDFIWWQVLIGFFIVHWTAGWILSTIFQMAHIVEGATQPIPDKNGIIHHHWTVHELLTTSDFARRNNFLNWYVGGLNFQIEHHLFTHISHVHYKKIAPIVEEAARQYGIPYNLKSNFFSAYRSHIKRLKELGKVKAS